MKNKFSSIKAFYCFTVTVNTISHFIFMFYKTTIYMHNTAKMINHAGTLSLTQNIFHTIRH